MRKLLSLASLLLVLTLALGACTAAPQEGTGATQEPGLATEAVFPQTGGTKAPAETVETTSEVDATASPEATAEAVGTASPEATAGTTTAATSGLDGTQAAEVTASPEMTATAVLPAMGIEEMGRISNWIGQTVYDASNQPVGQVSDIAIDISTRKAAYVLVSQGEELDNSPVVIPVNWRAFNLENGKPLVVSVTTEDVEAAPTLHMRAVPALIPTDWEEEFANYWIGVLELPETEASEEAAATTPEPTETTEAAPEGIILASDLLEQAITTGDGTELGSVDDLIVDIETGDITFILVRVAENLGLKADVLPIPLGLLNQDATTMNFSVDINPSILQQAPSFGASDFPSLSDSTWDDALLDFWNQYLPTE